MDVDLAKKLLRTFNNPVSSSSQNYDMKNLKGGFISTSDYFEKPHCACAYFVGHDGYTEFYLEWYGIEGHDDAQINLEEHFTFAADTDPRNWCDSVRLTKRFLEAVVQG